MGSSRIEKQIQRRYAVCYLKRQNSTRRFGKKSEKFAEEEVKPIAFMMDQNNEFPKML